MRRQARLLTTPKTFKQQTTHLFWVMRVNRYTTPPQMLILELLQFRLTQALRFQLEQWFCLLLRMVAHTLKLQLTPTHW